MNAPHPPGPLVAVGHRSLRHAAQELALPALLVRRPDLLTPIDELVHLYVPQEPTVAFTGRDLRSAGIAAAARVAESAGFRVGVRAPGGRMVAYDRGAVVVDHLTYGSGLAVAGGDTFAAHAGAHAAVLGALGVPDVRVGEVPGEYCPGEYSVNVGGAVKVIGSAQRVTATGALFSTVLQVALSERVRQVIIDVSAALGYELATSTVGGLTDTVAHLHPDTVLEALAEDYVQRLTGHRGDLPPGVEESVAGVGADGLFHADDWARTQPRP